MDKNLSADILREKFERTVLALEALPDGVEILNVLIENSDRHQSYIQLYSRGVLPGGPQHIEYYEDGTPEYSVKLYGVKVLWIGEEEGEKNENI